MSTEPRRFVVAAAALGVALRLGVAALALRDPAIPIEPDDYLEMGAAFLRTGHYAQPAYPPLYTVVVGALRVLSPAAVYAVVVLQALLSILTLRLAYDAVARLFPTRPTLAGIALAVVALDPLVLVYPAFVMTEVVFVAEAFVLLRLLGDAVHGQRGARRALGPWLGVMLLTRSVTTVVAAALFVAALVEGWRSPSRGALTTDGLVAVGGLAAVVAPWMAYVYAEYGVLAITSSSDYNVAALYVNAAVCAVEHVGCKASIENWFPAGGMPAHPFEAAAQARAAAVAWAAAHPVPLLSAFIKGYVARMFTPSGARWLQLLGSAGRVVSLGSLGYRCLFAVGTLAGAFAGRRDPVVLLLAALFGVQFLALGPVADGRFLVSLVPFAVPLVATVIPGLRTPPALPESP